MSRPARFLSIRPFLFSPVSGNQCRRVALGYAGNPRRCLNTSHPWNATLAAPASTSASAPRHASGPPPARPSELLSFPSQQDIDDAEIEVELVPLPEARMQITDRAAEQLRRISTKENDPSIALRISVESGGCHGYQYKMDLTSERQPEDYLFSHPSVKPASIIIDAVSMPLLKGSTLDFATELIGSTFRILENPQAKGSGCGCGVSWELKL